MKILWVTNTPCGLVKELNPNFNLGGWLIALEEELANKTDINLHIAFYWNKKIPATKKGLVNYHPIYRKHKSNVLKKIYSRLLNRTNNKKDLTDVLKIIKTVNPDLIHIHGTEENFGLLQTKTTIPSVVSIQGLLCSIVEKFFSGIPKFENFVFEGIKPKVTLSSEWFIYRSMIKNAKREIEILKSTKNIIGRTNWDKNISLLLSNRSNYFVNNEILRAPFYENQWLKNKYHSTYKIVSIISGGLYKGIETIFKVSNLLKEHTTLDFQWNIIGINGTNESVKTIKKWLKIDPNNVNINFCGTKNELEIIEFFLDSDLYCQVSHIENSPNSLCEAMLVGLPIIATHAGGTQTLLENLNDGILIQDGDPYSMAGAINELSQNFTQAKIYGNNARQKALIRHNKETVISDLLRIYNTVIQCTN
jgi:glycosyltransferase involved in cell wall biosynthesis